MSKKKSGSRMALTIAIAFFMTSPHAAEPLIPFELEDYAETTYTNETWAGKSILMFVAGRDGATYNNDDSWAAPVVAHLQENNHTFIAVSIADVSGTPRLARSFLRRMFKPAQEDPVGLTLLDWDGNFSRTYGLSEDAYHILVFDAEHNLVYKDALREFDSAQLSTLLTSLNNLLSAE